MKPILLLVALALFTQREFAQEVTFKTETKLVIVNVTVKGKDGKPLTSLKKEDIEIYEDGVKQNLAVFELETLSSDLLPAVAATPSTPVTLEERVQAPAGQAVTTAVNTAPARHQDKRLVALFFDFSNMPQADQLRAKDAAVDFVTKQMTASDLVSIMAYGNRFDVLEDFTADRDRLLSRLQKMATGEGAGLADTAATGADSTDDSGTFTADDTEFNVFNTDRKLTALEDATKKLAAYPEKKALIYFASGLTLTGLENQSQLRATVNSAVRANVSIYAVDARGLTAESPVGDASTASGRGTGAFTGATQSSRRNSVTSSQDTLYTLASDTGGKALVDSNDLAMGIRQAQQDISSYYILGYYSSNAAEDGKYRKIQVKLLGKDLQSIAKVDYRNGYYAGKTFAKFTAGDKERQLEEALTLGDPVSELPLALEVDYFRVAQNRYLVPISLKIPGSVLALAKKGGKQSTDFDFIGQVRENPSGKLVGGVRDNIPVKLSDADASQLEHRHLQYDAGLTLPPGKYNLRFLARENQTGKMGTFETNFVVPDLSVSKDLRLSSVILSSQKEDVKAAVGSADNDKRALANHPLIQNGQKTVPSITRVFRKDQTLYVYFEVYDPAPDGASKAPSLSAEVDLLQGARKALSSMPAHQDKMTPNRPGVASFSFQMPLAKMAAGQYTAQINVIDEAGKRFAFPRSAIVVLP
ncbi:MAG: VWA domain-containing protein [Acidobacteriia bacterium]|nr:VWA domain-containing protein [Terriglobia bacterium]